MLKRFCKWVLRNEKVVPHEELEYLKERIEKATDLCYKTKALKTDDYKAFAAAFFLINNIHSALRGYDTLSPQEVLDEVYKGVVRNNEVLDKEASIKRMQEQRLRDYHECQVKRFYEITISEFMNYSDSYAQSLASVCKNFIDRESKVEIPHYDYCIK